MARSKQEVKVELGGLLRYYRGQAGFTQTTQAARMNYDTGSAVSRMESGKFESLTRAQIDKFVAATGVKLSPEDDQKFNDLLRE